jgi:hypothetical protein
VAKDHNRPLTFTVALSFTLHDPAQAAKAFGVEGRDALRQAVKVYTAGQARGGVFEGDAIDASIDLKH